MKTLRTSKSLAVFLPIYPLSRSTLLDVPIDELDSLRLAVLYAQLQMVVGKTLAAPLMRAFMCEHSLDERSTPHRT
jgi:hypothetical protein